MTSSTSAEPAAPERTVLGVERSALGRRWVERVGVDDARIQAIETAAGVDPLVARVLAGRGIEPQAAASTLAPSIRELMPDPATLVDCEKTAERLAEAIARRETVALFGDYDVDGATSVALMLRYLRAFGLEPIVHIPDRLTEGYGPNVPAIEALADMGARLLVTLDCGSASFEPFARARELGLDILVIDHHQIGDDHPPADAIVNPNRGDDRSDLGHLAAVGVTFMVLVALNRRMRQAGRTDLPDLLMLLDLVALGTVADVVPLTGLNRAFVVKGLAAAHLRGNAGLSALCDVARLTGPPEPYHLGFLIGPRINAGGRIGNAALGAELLTTDDPHRAMTIAAELDRLNAERQDIERLALEEAEARALHQVEAEQPVIVVAGEDWHPGVLGLVAARLKERHDRPAFALAPNMEGDFTGSGRSVPGVDLGRAVRRLVDEGFLVKGGGHAMAAGVTLKAGGLDDFRGALAGLLGDAVGAAREASRLRLDGVMTATAASTAAVKALLAAGPFGAAFPEPLIAFPGHRLADIATVGAGGHIRVTLLDGGGGRLKAIAFRAAGGPLGPALMEARDGRPRHVVGSLSLDHWGGNPKPQLRIVDVALP